MQKVLDVGNGMADLLQANKCRRGERWARDTPRWQASSWWDGKRANGSAYNTSWEEVRTLLLYHMAQFFTDRGARTIFAGEKQRRSLRIAAHVEDV